MHKITTAKALKEAILALEQQQIKNRQLLEGQFSAALESLGPINLLHKQIKEFKLKPLLKTNISQTAIALLSGYLAHKIIVGPSKSPFRRFAASIVQYGISKYISKNTPLF